MTDPSPATPSPATPSPATRTRVLDALRQQRVETASWAYANSGTRFKVFPQQGVPRTPEEKVDDAATVHRFTAVAPTVALHIPWDRVAGYQALVRRRHELPGAGRHSRPAGTARGRPAGDVRPARRRPADPAGVQALRARLLHHGRAGLGHRVPALRRARAQGAGGHRHRPPRP